MTFQKIPNRCWCSSSPHNLISYWANITIAPRAISQISKFSKFHILSFLGCQNILEIPVLGCELVLGTTSGETGAVLRDCTCAPHVPPASSPNTIHSRSSLGGRREHLWAGSGGFQNMPKQPRRPAVYLTCPVPAISPICPVSPRRPNSPTHLV